MPSEPLLQRALADDEVRRALAEARALGFLGPGAIDDHLRHSARFLVALGDRLGSPAADLGSGGGVPGLVLARLAPSVAWLFVEANHRRAGFLREAVTALSLVDRVEVVAERAETIGRSAVHRGRYRTVVSRSFGPPAVVAECAAPLLSPGGHLVVSEPPAPGRRWPAEALAGLRLHEVASFDPGFWVGEQTEHAPDRYPRRVGIPAKRPLF